MSAATHIAVLAVMACWGFPTGRGTRQREMVASLLLRDEPPVVLTISSVRVPERVEAADTDWESNEDLEWNEDRRPSRVVADLPPLSFADRPTGATRRTLFGSSVDDRVLQVAMPDQALLAQGTSAELASYASAIDVLARDLASMLDQSHVTLIWCFDESRSMKDDQLEISRNIVSLYDRLTGDSSPRAHRCESAVTSYGRHFRRHVRRPSVDVGVLGRAMLAIPEDTTGTERMCEALLHCLSYFEESRSSEPAQLAIVLVTDETGDRDGNERRLEEVVTKARASGAKIYVLGREALFGADQAWMRWNGEAMAIDRGPETAFPTQLACDAFGRRSAAIGSGFGPYEQCRLAAATNGRFFMLAGSEDSLLGVREVGYDRARLAPLAPELDDRDQLQTRIDASPLRTALIRIARESAGIADATITDALPLQFVGNESALRTSFERNEKAANLRKEHWSEAARALAEVRSHRDREEHPRWRADYDWMESQLAAYELRTSEYARLMRELHSTLRAGRASFATARISIVPTARPSQDAQANGVSRAEHLLSEVATRYASTPWGVRAADELALGLGLAWTTERGP